MTTTVYKIRCKSNGLFSNGGYKPKFNKKGKMWLKICDIKNHLHLFSSITTVRNARYRNSLRE